MARYFLRFRHSDTGLSPTFTFFKRATDLAAQASPPIGEVGGGTYYFDYVPTFDVIFEVDGGTGIPTEEVRFIADTLSPKDTYLDSPTSAIKGAVWEEPTASHVTVGTFGKLVSDTKTAVDSLGGGSGVDPAAIAAAVWGSDITSYIVPGQSGEVVMRLLRFLANRMRIDTVTNLLTVYRDDGTSVLAQFTLKDNTGMPNAKKPFERVP